ncbi:MAG TPA: peptidase M23 [Candidatus Dormibacteraeota bacterium]|nr:peptidase M23 [Candidatus Dormibacteraeota bacterium]
MEPMKMVKAKLEEVDGMEKLEFKFNPSEYSVQKTAQWDAPKRSMSTKAGAKPEFIGSGPQTVSLQIFFDDWEAPYGDVTKHVEKLFKWCQPSQKSTARDNPHPPLLRLIWGSNLHLAEHKFYLASVNAKYTMFGRTGNPLRATADISLKESPDEPAAQNPTSGSIHARATHLISEGDTLQSIATNEYGNPNLWRGLATFNDIDDPLRLNIGSRILIPSRDEAADGAKGS